MSIVTSVAGNQIPRASGVELILAGFPLDRAQAERIMGDTGRGFTPAASATPAAADPSPSPGAPAP